jgi:hypothetical protein
MRRAAFFSLLVTATTLIGVAAAGLLPAACDSTLNLSGDEGGSASSGEGGNSGGDASCPGVCDKFIACGFAESAKRDACISDCVKGAPQPLLDCVARTSCADMQRVCPAYLPEVGIPIFDSSAQDDELEIRRCQSSCDSSQFFDCLTASEHATCRDLCATAPASMRNSFRSCASGAGGNCTREQDCFKVLVGD